MSGFDPVRAANTIRRAIHVVLVWSPWWSRYVGKCQWKYVDDSSQRITGLSSMVMLADVGFVCSAPLMEVAVAVEFALQQSVRGMDVRGEKMLREYPYTDESLVGLAEALEINSDIASKFAEAESQWSAMVSRSFDKSYVDNFDASEPPSLPEGATVPDDLGFEDGLTAEKYIRLLVEREREREQEWLDSQEEPQENLNENPEENPEENPKESTQEEPQENPEENHQEEPNENPQENSREDSHGENNETTDPSESTENDQEGDRKDEQLGGYKVPKDKGNTSGGDSGDSTGGSSGESGEENLSGEQKDDDPEDQTEAHTGNSQDGSENEESSNLEQQDFGDSHTNTRDTEGDTSDSEGNVEFDTSDLADTPAHVNNEMDTPGDRPKRGKGYRSLTDELVSKSSGESTVHEMSIPQIPPSDELRGVDFEEREDAKKELAEDIQEHKLSIPTTGGISGGSFDEWATKKLHVPKANWKKTLPAMLTSVMARTEMSGVSDMSYSKSNPNQQPGMPIMMGFVTYPPEVTILIDASPSMLSEKNKTMSEFMGLMQKFLMRYSQPITVAVADSGIKGVVSSIAPTKDVLKYASRTYHGTSQTFGETLMKIAKKGAKYKSRNYPAPDILVVFTDCLFTWGMPTVSSLPYSYATVVVASTREYSEVEEFLPSWVKKGENFVYLND